MISLLFAIVASSAPTHPIVPDDFFSLASIWEAEWSPDGQRIAYIESRWSEQSDGRESALWSVGLEGGPPTRLSFLGAHRGVKWGLDDEWIYFLSSDKTKVLSPFDGSQQVYRVASSGGVAQPITAVPRGVKRYELHATGLYYQVGVDETDDDPFSGLRASHSLNYGHGTIPASALHRLDLNTWRSEEVLAEKRVINAFKISPDGHRIALLTQPDGALMLNEGWSRVDIWDDASGQVQPLPDALWRENVPSPYGWLSGLSWSDDSEALAFRVDYDGFPGALFVAEFDSKEHRLTREVRRSGDYTLAGEGEWRPNTRTYCQVVADHAILPIHCWGGLKDGQQGREFTLTGPDESASRPRFSPDGSSIAYRQSLPDKTADLALRSLKKKGGVRLITHINPQADDWQLPQLQVVKWTAPDGTPVEGILELPYDYKPEDSPLPTVIQLHGGPTWATAFSFALRSYGRSTFSSRGWAVLSPNYRGSIGYGDAFLMDLVGRENDVEVKDILAGVDFLVEQGIADPDRLAVMGWSNGGYLTNCLIATTDRFKAASSGAGVFDQGLQWATEDTPGHVVNFMQGLPWQRAAEHQKASPMYSAQSISTPTLIHVGEDDPRVPLGHSQALYRALRHYLDVPVELVVYPGEGHSLSAYSHRKAKMAWDIAWFDRYVLGVEPSEDTP